MKDFKNLIDNGADVNHQDKLGFSALMAASKKGDFKAVRLLVTNGAYINLKDYRHCSALHYATAHNHLEIVKYLVTNGANIGDDIYMTAIHKNYKNISLFFDSLDASMQVLAKN